MAASASEGGEAPASSGLLADYAEHWFDRVARTQSEQPYWLTPLVTFSPRLGEEYRYDQIWQTSPAGRTLTSYGGNKGPALIPWDSVEIFIGLPAWQTYNHPSGVSGWGDENLLLKWRLASANRTNGDYVITAFVGLAIPSGSAHLSSGHFAVTPWISAGKGWGRFDVQSSLGVSIPDYGAAAWGNGTPVLWNTTLQYHAARYLWPEFEFNQTYWPDGIREGRSQLYATPGVLFGKIPLWRRLGVIVGAGYQMALTSKPVNDHALILSLRLPF